MDTLQARRPWLFAIKFPDGTIALCRGTQVIRVVIQGERPEGWESSVLESKLGHSMDKPLTNLTSK